MKRKLRVDQNVVVCNFQGFSHKIVMNLIGAMERVANETAPEEVRVLTEQVVLAVGREVAVSII